MTMGPIQKTFLVLRPFEGALTCSILTAGTQVMLRKAYFLRRGSWLRPESLIAPLCCCVNFELFDYLVGSEYPPPGHFDEFDFTSV
jgi:hypothetical protein